MKKLDGFTYSHDEDFYGYHLMDSGNAYYIDGRDGDMLIGDQLPSTEELAKIYCRCANIAFQNGMKHIYNVARSELDMGVFEV